MSTVQPVPMWRLTERIVRSGLVMAWRFATSPTSTSPVLEKPTTDGVVLPPSAFGITTGSPASNTLTTELVVPRSIPTALAISAVPSARRFFCRFRPAPLCPVRALCDAPEAPDSVPWSLLLCTSVAKLSPCLSRFLRRARNAGCHHSFKPKCPGQKVFGSDVRRAAKPLGHPRRPGWWAFPRSTPPHRQHPAGPFRPIWALLLPPLQ